MTDEPIVMIEFDFDVHRESAVSQYRKDRPVYELLAVDARQIVKDTLNVAGIRFHSIEARAKSIDSFGGKASKPSDFDPTKPKYPDPLKQITDLAAIRVITFLPRTVGEVCQQIENEFTVLEKIDKAAELMDEGRLGYQSIHFVVQMHPNRTRLPEYQHYKDLTFEIQVRTILQHAWAEMEHDIQYKSTAVIPASIRRRFIALAGVLEIADREFQELQEEDERLRQQARQSVQSGELTHVEITPDALKSYLDKKLGSDGRMAQWSYSYTANLLRQLGFETLSQLEECIEGYDDDCVCRAVWGLRQGQLTRFEMILQAAMGENFVNRHPWCRDQTWLRHFEGKLERLRNAGIPIGSYDPCEHKAELHTTSNDDDA
jgi:ppGpp synthetase/RelA/SpoT-type nucleotidyltranferase